MQTLAEKLRLAAEIVEKKAPWQARREGDEWRDEVNMNLNHCVFSCTTDPEEIRIKPSSVMVPLSPEDILPGSIVRLKGGADRWRAVLCVWPRGIETVGGVKTLSAFDFEECRAVLEIKRPGEDWKPCEKPAPDSR